MGLRHGHEWKLFKDVRLPEGKLLIPGVLGSTTNFIEHPELVQQRVAQYAGLVGRGWRARRVMPRDDYRSRTNLKVKVLDSLQFWWI